MAMGRPPKSSILKAVEGNRAKRGRGRIKEDVRGRGLPVPPSNLTKGELGLWSSIVAALPTALLSGADVSVLERMVVAWARCRTIEKTLKVEGLIVATPQGRIRNPLVSILKDTHTEMHRCGSELGLSPAARARLPGGNEPDTDDIMDALLGMDGNLDATWWEKPQ